MTSAQVGPICMEYATSGTCQWQKKNGYCQYRHLEHNHPEVMAQLTRAASEPPRKIVAKLAPGQVETDLPDPGPKASLCEDLMETGRCTRLRTGQGCMYRHLQPFHPDVLSDRVRRKKMTAGTHRSPTYGLAGAELYC